MATCGWHRVTTHKPTYHIRQNPRSQSLIHVPQVRSYIFPLHLPPLYKILSPSYPSLLHSSPFFCSSFLFSSQTAPSHSVIGSSGTLSPSLSHSLSSSFSLSSYIYSPFFVSFLHKESYLQSYLCVGEVSNF